MDIGDLVLYFVKNFDSLNSFIKTLSHIFLIGFGAFLIFYLKTLKDHLISWRNMDSFDKIVFILILGLIIIIPAILYSLLIFFIGMMFYEIFAPYVCGSMMDYFALIFIVIILAFLLYIAYKFKIKKIDSKILILVFSMWKPLKYLLWINIILFGLVLVLGILRNCISFTV